MALYRALLPLFIYVCRSALGQSVVEVEVGAPSVTLPGTVRPLVNVPSARWSRGSEEVHVRFLKDDDFRKQNPLFKDRTQMNPDALESGNVSLELKGPTLTDSGTYRCVVREDIKEVDRFTVELRVKGLKVDVTEGSSSISLPFPLMRTLESEVSVKWTFGSEEVHLRRGGADDFSAQSGQFKGRTQMKSDALQSGDLSLELKDLTLRDSGHYTCVVTEGSTELARTTVHLTVEPRPWTIIILTIISILFLLLVLLLLPVLLIVVLFLTQKRKKQTHEPDSNPVSLITILFIELLLLLLLIALLISVVILMKNQTHDPVPVILTIISIVLLLLFIVLLLVVLFLTHKRKKQTHEPDSKPVITIIIKLILILLLPLVLLISVVILMKNQTHDPALVTLIIITIVISIVILLPLPVLLIVVLFLTHKRKKETHESWSEALKGTVTCRPHPIPPEKIQELRVKIETLCEKIEESCNTEEVLRVRDEVLRVREELFRLIEEAATSGRKPKRAFSAPVPVREELLSVIEEERPLSS